MSERIVVTGMGAVTPVGIGVDEYWKNLLASKSGIDYIKRFDTDELPVKFAACVDDFDPLKYMTKKQTREMDLFMQYGFAATKEAVEDAVMGGSCGKPLEGLSNEELADILQTTPERVGIVIGTAMQGVSIISETQNDLSTGKHKRVSPRFVPKFIGNITAAQIGIEFGFCGPSYTVSTACSSGVDAISNAAMLLKSDDIDICIVCGAEASLCPVVIDGLYSAHALSERNDDPSKASRPFDKDRDGFVFGEGGGCMVLETLSHAKKRNARMYSELLGYGNTTDAHHVTAPHPDGKGAVLCMEKALNRAKQTMKLRAEQEGSACEDIKVDYINAHGTSTPMGDVIETGAIKKLFGDEAYNLAVSSTKGATGHMMGAGGVTEAIACVKAICDNKIPPTLNLDVADEKCDLNYVPGTAIDREVKVAMSNAFGFGGQNATVIFGEI